MRGLLTASLVAGLALASASAQRMSSGGHAAGAAPHGFSAPHMSGGFTAGTHFSPSPVTSQHNFAPPAYRMNVPGRYSAGRPSYPSGGSYNPEHRGGNNGRRPYSNSRYRRPYVPYFYANSTYLVPGLLNSYWDYPDNFLNDDSGSAAQSQPDNSQPEVADNGYAPEPEPYQPAPRPPQDIPPPPPGPSEPAPQAAVTLVFKDGHSQQIHNYAMTRTTLYLLDDAASGRRHEISLDQLDVSATEKANREAGVDFQIPTGN